ncbi:MAG: hypothetical protein OEO77_14735 [Acidimicrobiia bacterium]|nr:hypothetical protein [Acidimicrobiia bacterium]
MPPTSPRHHVPFPGSIRRVAIVLTVALAVAGCGRGEAANPSAPPIIVTTTSTSSTTTTVPPPTTTTTVPPTTTTTTVELAVALAPDGLMLVRQDNGSTTSLLFGSPQETVLTALENVLGPAGDVGPGIAECPNGQDAVGIWPNIINVEFAGGEFLAWSLLQNSTLTDMTGVGLGSTLAELTSTWNITVLEGTLGTEFYTEPAGMSIGGLLSASSETAIVTAYWAGPICAFR